MEMALLPGMEGYFGIKANHVPIIAQLKPGVVELHDGADVAKYFVSGGFAFMHPNRLVLCCFFVCLAVLCVFVWRLGRACGGHVELRAPSAVLNPLPTHPTPPNNSTADICVLEAAPLDQFDATAVKTALQISDLYGDNNGPVNATLVPLLSDVFISDVSAAATATLGAAGVFQGLGATPAQGQITGVVLTNVSLGTPAGGWKCSNVTGKSAAVFPAPCKELDGGDA